MVKVPPAVPRTAVPTLAADPFTALTVSVSPSTSLSAPLPLSASTEPVTGAFSVVAMESLRATGASLTGVTVPLTVATAVAVPSDRV